MIASWRGLCVAAALAIALAVVVAVDAARTGAAPGSEDRALVPGFDPARATALIWERAGQPAIRAERVGDRWELRAPAAIPADPGAIGDVLAALRGARWHRRGDAPPAGATLTVIAAGARHVVGLAGPIAGTEQSWVVADGRGAVVDRWVARALDRDRLALQVRRPLADVASAQAITVTGRSSAPIRGPAPAAAPAVDLAARRVDLQLEGAPRRLVRPAALLLAPPYAGELERALRDLTIVQLPAAALPPGSLQIRATWRAPAPGESAAEVTVALGGGCPGAPELAAVSGLAGGGCIAGAARAAIERAVDRLRAAPERLVEPRPVPFDVAHLALADGAALDTSPPRLGGAAADEARVAELLAALAAPAAVVRLPAGPPIARLTATDRAGTAIDLELYAERVLARRGEPVALRPAPGAWALLVRPSRELRELTLWVEEPTTITALAIDGVRYERGQVIGAWTRAPAGAADAARVEALVGQLAAPRALGPSDRPFAVAHRVTIEVVPPVGAATRHALELGEPRGAGCPARAGGDAVMLPAAVCREVAALSRPPAGQ